MTLHTKVSNFTLHTIVDFAGNADVTKTRVDVSGNTRVDASGNIRVVTDTGKIIYLHTRVSKFTLHTEIDL